MRSMRKYAKSQIFAYKQTGESPKSQNKALKPLLEMYANMRNEMR